ncbi:hypothetical protein K474DRAFT_1696309 [Panus rudis PR-1116 ss-1]|nr:hypothetical protein K474DRAFT_1696309 [Panus rudis PR-1116 ss-1]
MATAESDTQKQPGSTSSPSQNVSPEQIADDFEKLNLQPQGQDSATLSDQTTPNSPRPLHVYSRRDLLLLSRSSLVKTPDALPALKHWFGDWNEQVANRKEAEVTGSNTNQRDRRFRRDPDDADPPSRPSFRTTLSQPSQMGNFRHQSIRTADREKDGDRERERDLRDKEGQERLRSLSDKYDRDRLALSSSALRSKDRDSAPHLTSGASGRLGTGINNSASRRTEGRELTKRKISDTGDDWRRGGDSTRASRDDLIGSDNLRRDRETRDRPRSRSRARREVSSTRRDRDRDDRDRDRDRRRDDRDRDDHGRRDRDEYSRRDWDENHQRDRDDYHRESRHPRDAERDTDEDPRRWRDDGRRDERIAARRDRDRDRERGERDRGWDRWEPSHERDDRDTRLKRGTRRPEEGKERDERRDKDKEKDKEREKEPAWMETYIPSASESGILGGQGLNGELDGIQAWKKGLRDKERKEKEGTDTTGKVDEPQGSAPSDAGATGQMDEIQLFKLLMKREAEKKEAESRVLETGTSTDSALSLPSNDPALKIGSGAAGPQTSKDLTATLPPHPDGQTIAQPSNAQDGARSLLSLISPPDLPVTSLQGIDSRSSGLDNNKDMPPPAVSRLLSASQNIGQPNPHPADASTPTPGPFNPPAGSRLLAFGSRATSVASANSNDQASKFIGSTELVTNSIMAGGPSIPPTQRLSGTHQPIGQGGSHMNLSGVDPLADLGVYSNARATPSDAGRSTRSYSPFAQAVVGPGVFDEPHESSHLRRSSVVSSLDRTSFSLGSENGSAYPDPNSLSSNFVGNGPPFDLGGAAATGANVAAGKGSRFAKFFDNKAREVSPGVPVRNGQRGPALGPSTSPLPNLRQDQLVGNGGLGNGPENRTMEDIFAMLQNSAQGHRASPQIGQPNRMQGGGLPFGQNTVDIHALQMQQLQQQAQFNNNRLDALYDSRLDDRSFVPDGMVPGLRPAPTVPRPRSREPSGLYHDQMEDPIQFNLQRMQQQQRNVEQLYAGPGTSVYGMNRNGPPMQQPPFRGGPSPNPNTLPGPSQRLPPGLANLGGRPPHDPSQYLGGPLGIPSSGLPNGMQPNPPAQLGLNNLGGGNLGFGGNMSSRGPIPGPHQTQMLNQMGGLGPGNNMDIRGPNQAQLLALSGGLGNNGIGGGMRGAGFNPQHGPGGQVQLPPLGIRQQQQHVPPQMMSQMPPPPHLQQQYGIPGGNAQGTQDLMALLMGGHRD